MNVTEILLGLREMQCLQRIAQGYTNKDIGAELFLSENTVKIYVSRLIDKLGAKDRAHCVGIAFQKGLLKISSAVG